MISKCFKFYGAVQNHLDANNRPPAKPTTKRKSEQRTCGHMVTVENYSDKYGIRCQKRSRLLFPVKNEFRDQTLSNVVTSLKGKFLVCDKGYHYSKTPLKFQFRYLK